MSVTRIFASAFARRLAYVLVALVLGWFGVGEANAQSCNAYADNCTPEQARAACLVVYNDPAWRGSYVPAAASNQDCTVVGNPPSLSGIVKGMVCYAPQQCAGSSRTVNKYFNATCPTGTSWDANSQTCFSCPAGQIKNDITGQCMDKCSTRPTPSFTPTGGIKTIPNGSVGCDAGCLYVSNSNGDGTFSQTFLGDSAAHHCMTTPGNCEDNGAGYTMNYALNMCVPPQIECAENQVKDPHSGECTDGCPLGKVMDANGQCKVKDNTCPAGQVKGPDGSCVQDSCPSGQTKGSDGTCKGSNDPDKDEGDDDKYFSGGDSCNAPPACSGDPILCGQARIQWRIDCNTRRNVNISGGSCAAIPVCTGEKCNAMEYAQLLQQWRGTCALEKIAKGEKGDGGDEQPGWTKVDGMNQDPGQGQTADDTKGVQTRTLSTNDLDSSGWLGGAGSCPAIMGGGGGQGLGGSFAQALASPPAYFCNFIGMMAAIVMIGGAYAAAYILAKG